MTSCTEADSLHSTAPDFHRFDLVLSFPVRNSHRSSGLSIKTSSEETAPWETVLFLVSRRHSVAWRTEPSESVQFGMRMESEHQQQLLSKLAAHIFRADESRSCNRNLGFYSTDALLPTPPLFPPSAPGPVTDCRLQT